MTDSRAITIDDQAAYLERVARAFAKAGNADPIALASSLALYPNAFRVAARITGTYDKTIHDSIEASIEALARGV